MSTWLAWILAAQVLVAAPAPFAAGTPVQRPPKTLGQALGRALFGQWDPVTYRQLVENGADVNEPLFGGLNLLMFAVARGDLPTVRWALAHGANPNTTHDAMAYTCGNAARKHPLTVLHLAASKPNPEIVRALLQAGADPTAKTRGGTTPLQQAIRSEETQNAQILREWSRQHPSPGIQ